MFLLERIKTKLFPIDSCRGKDRIQGFIMESTLLLVDISLILIIRILEIFFLEARRLRLDNSKLIFTNNSSRTTSSSKEFTKNSTILTEL